MPPLHPALVHFPIALITISVLADLLGRIFRNAAMRSAAWWTLMGGTVGAAVSVPLGYFDMNRASLTAETHAFVDLHLNVGWLLLIAVVGLTLWRAHFHTYWERPVRWSYLATALLVLGLTLFQGWMGGELVYSRGAGVAAAGQGTESARQAQQRLNKVGEILGAVPGFREFGEANHRHREVTEPAGAPKLDHRNDEKAEPQ